jgi:hypothetical protein
MIVVVKRGVDWPGGALRVAVLALLAGCRAAPQPESPPMPAARTTPASLEPSQSNSIPAVDDCGLTAYPVSRPLKKYSLQFLAMVRLRIR